MSSSHTQLNEQTIESHHTFKFVNEDNGQSEEDLPKYPPGLRLSGIFRTWTEVSRVNYTSAEPLHVIKSGQSIRRKTIGIVPDSFSLRDFVLPHMRNKTEEEMYEEQFPINVTPLMNEDQLWGCFYTFPELYADVYSPVVAIRSVQDLPELVDGVLTRDMITACLSYLKRTPILGDFVYIKLDLSSQNLTNIEVLQHYKYLVYLDLSSNWLSELSVLSHLLYLQYLSVASNRLCTVLEYDTPQWYLTEVHYKFNSVQKIRDLSAFWSITILDLSHNNIKSIDGLEGLMYLRRLDLSFNHIQRLENLNHLRLLWLDLSYNNISSFEHGPSSGLWTLLHLEYLNLNENNLVSMKIFSECSRLRELHVRNNRLSSLLELAVYMRQMRRLIILDMRVNPICLAPGYTEVVLNVFPILLSLNGESLDPVEQCNLKMEMRPDLSIFATRRLLRLLYIEQLSRARVSPSTPPADTTEVPLVVIVGYEAVGKGSLVRRLASECSTNISLARQHTTASYHFPGHYIEVTRSKFDDMLLAGEFLTYTEANGESYGLSRDEALIKDGKVKIVAMDLIGALMLKLRGRQPYLILASCSNTVALAIRQHERKMTRDIAYFKKFSTDAPYERSNLQILLSGRILITGILNEILLSLPEDKENSKFLIESKCSLLMDSEARQAVLEKEMFTRGFNLINLVTSSSSSLDIACKHVSHRTSQMDTSLYSLYKEGTNYEFVSELGRINSFRDGTSNLKKYTNEQRNYLNIKQEKVSNVSRAKSADFQTDKYNSSTWKGSKSKSVTFTSQDDEIAGQVNVSGLTVIPYRVNEDEDLTENKRRSVSTRFPKFPYTQHPNHDESQDDLDLWLAFLMEIGLLQASETTVQDSYDKLVSRESNENSNFFKQMEICKKVLCDTTTTSIKDDYEAIHIQSPGLFWNTVSMDDADSAFHKVKRIIQDIVNSQKNLKPMFDIDFANLNYYPAVENRLLNIHNQIAPQRLFY